MGEDFERLSGSRSNLGDDMPVAIYRMMQYTMQEVLRRAHGVEKARSYFRQAGVLSGIQFTKNLLDLQQELSVFLANLQKRLCEMKIGILRIEAFDAITGDMTLTLREDLSYSGLEMNTAGDCSYSEGFFTGIFETYMGCEYEVRGVDCWISGGNIHRFSGRVKARGPIPPAEKGE